MRVQVPPPAPRFPRERQIETPVSRGLAVLSPLRKYFGWMQTKLRRNSWLRRRVRVEDAFEAFAVLKEDQHPQHRGYQSRSNARRRKRQVKRKDVVELR